MHQTTVRFAPDLWEALEEECAHQGVSAAQYIREAVLARLTYTAGRRGEGEYEEALTQAGAAPTDPAPALPARRSATRPFQLRDEIAMRAAADLVENSSALSRQSIAALARAHAPHERSEAVRERARRWKR